jgi:translation initiation factor 2B subunit (eIF-2B alpha/beta/delta family)
MPTNVSTEVDLIKNDWVHGARELTVQALQGMKRLIEQYYTDDEEELTKFLLTASRAFAEARPSMISIANSIATVPYLVMKRVHREKELRECILEKIDLQLSTLNKAFAGVVSNAANLVRNNSTIVTCSYSSTVIEALIRAKKLGKSFNVLALRSPSSNGSLEYARLTCKKLHEAELECEVVDEVSIKDSLRSFAFVGVDSIYPDGAVLNGSPTLRLAQEASKQYCPFYVVSETWKINPLPLLGVNPAIESGMDIVLTELITAIVTEYGLLESGDVSAYAIDFSKRLKTVISENRR